MKNCGRRFHNEVGKFRFLNELIKVISPKVCNMNINCLLITNGDMCLCTDCWCHFKLCMCLLFFLVSSIRESED